VTVTPLYDEANMPLGVTVSFPDVTSYHRLQKELQRSKEEIQTASEELQSNNEELETTNEELQSTNEELETMNEELQSTNEEMQTVNEELRQRTDELNHANAFLQSIVSSLSSAAIVLNQHFNILLWNHRAEDLWGLREDEVKGTSFLNLEIGLPVHQLRAAIRACLAGEADHQEITLDAINRRGKAITCRIGCNPLMSPDKARQGIILLMEEEERIN
jgi:two-component system, chemotaxis family, CheB/CheR fusion protein